MGRSRSKSDEAYVVDLCDEVLGASGLTQFRFDFLRGDARPGRTGRMLPVDVYYPELCLVVEYRERQHEQATPFFDKPERMTVSGVDRREQRLIYDQRRREVLPEYGIRLVEVSCEDLAHDSRGRLLRRRAEDVDVVGGLIG
jgi:hypothetical protein